MDGMIGLGPFGYIALNGSIAADYFWLYGVIAVQAYGVDFFGNISTSGGSDDGFQLEMDLNLDLYWFGYYRFSGLATPHAYTSRCQRRSSARLALSHGDMRVALGCTPSFKRSFACYRAWRWVW